VQTPGISHFFGCRPLGPLGWTIALAASGAGTVVALAAPATIDAVGHLVGRLPGLRTGRLPAVVSRVPVLRVTPSNGTP
jgi:hypothetical protein